MRGIWTIYLIIVGLSFAALECYALVTHQLPLTGWVRAVTVANPIAASVLFVVVAILLSAHFWWNVKPALQ